MQNVTVWFHNTDQSYDVVVCLFGVVVFALFVVETDKVLKERYLIGQNNAIYNLVFFFGFFLGGGGGGLGFFSVFFSFKLIN